LRDYLAMGEIMKHHILALAALAVMGFSGVAFAEDGKATAPKAMSDSEMDQVTAGRAYSGLKVETHGGRLINQSKPDDHSLKGFQGTEGSENGRRQTRSADAVHPCAVC
jgi:hypothetical protein